MSDLKLETYISIISALFAALSAIYAKRQASSAEKQYNLQLRLYKDGNANFKIETDTGFIFINNFSDNIYFFIPVLISNISDKSTSLKDFSLILHCGENLNYKPVFTNEIINEYSSLEQLHVGENINPHSSCMGWCLFRLPKENYNRIDINKYSLSISDIHEYSSTISFVFLREEVINFEI